MKTTILTTAALIGAVLFPAIVFADPAADCVKIDKGGYFAFERGCASTAGKLGAGSGYIDQDGNPKTEPTYTADKDA